MKRSKTLDQSVTGRGEQPRPDVHMTLKQLHKLPIGVYLIHWKSGGSSYAAIGYDSVGDMWIAPCNWVNPDYANRICRRIKSVEAIQTGLVPVRGLESEGWR